MAFPIEKLDEALSDCKQVADFIDDLKAEYEASGDAPTIGGSDDYFRAIVDSSITHLECALEAMRAVLKTLEEG